MNACHRNKGRNEGGRPVQASRGHRAKVQTQMAEEKRAALFVQYVLIIARKAKPRLSLSPDISIFRLSRRPVKLNYLLDASKMSALYDEIS